MELISIDTLREEKSAATAAKPKSQNTKVKDRTLEKQRVRRPVLLPRRD
jgi:hypothetical protein